MLAGNWEGKETMYPSDWDPGGGTAIGRTTSAMGVGGFALITDYEQERGGTVAFSGHGFYTYDPKEDLYTLCWIDSMGSPPEIFTGGFSGDVLILGHGGQMHLRLTWDLSKTDYILSKMEMSEDGTTWKKLYDADYKRTAAAG